MFPFSSVPNDAMNCGDEKGNIYVVGYEGMIYKMDLDDAVFDLSPNAAAGQTGRGR